jgi:hypothetical protein
MDIDSVKKSKGPTTIRTARNIYTRIGTSIVDAAGDWVEMAVSDDRPGNVQSSVYRSIGQALAEVSIQDGILYGRMRKDA